MNCTGKVGVVTGAANTIGRESAWAFAARGPERFALTSTTRGWRVAHEHEREAEPDHCDVSSANDVERLMAAANRHDRPSALICNAAIQYERTVEDTPRKIGTACLR